MIYKSLQYQQMDDAAIMQLIRSEINICGTVLLLYSKDL